MMSNRHGDPALRVMNAPSPAVLETVLEIWRRTMGPKGQHPNADLRHMGIGVKRLLQMLDEIEQVVGTKIPVGTALRLGTAEAIANAVTTDQWPSPSPLLLLKDGDDRPPLYLIAGAHSILLEIVALAQATQHGGKIWGFQPPGFEGEAPHFESIQATAERYVELIGGDPAERINIVGYSLGGEVAFEMARLLRARNRKLGLIGLIDTNIAERSLPLATRVRYLTRSTLSRVQGLARAPAGKRLEAVRNLVRPLVNRVIGLFTYNPAFTRYYEPSLDDRIKVVKDLALAAHERYVLQPVDFPVVLFKSWKSAKLDLVDPVETWRPNVPQLEVVEVDGTHATMILPPFVHRLASEISARLS